MAVTAGGPTRRSNLTTSPPRISCQPRPRTSWLLTLSGDLSADNASLAHHDLIALTVQLFPYEPFANRTWELRENVTCYDAWHIALAESLGATVATLDRKLAQAPGPRCEFITLLTEGDDESQDAAQ